MIMELNNNCRSTKLYVWVFTEKTDWSTEKKKKNNAFVISFQLCL